MTGTPPPFRAAIYDLDRTVLRTPTFTLFLLWAAWREAPWRLLLLPVVLTTLMHMMFVGSVRYRVPVMPMVMVLAAACLSGGPARRERRGMPPSADQGPGRAFMTSE